MGYYTYFDGYVVHGDKDTERKVALAIAHLPEFNAPEIDFETIDTINDVIAQEGMKWYDWEKDLKEVSKQFPDVLIRISGDGEDREDSWIAYIQNGKSVIYYAQITYPCFYPDDLK